uniref:hypothetical protein n=1 Tax=Bradyrhizobium sp. (strain ORS 278) TaxID=114615 RepID=UPI0002F76EDC|nr:hypothetical protein [Bradyrhizobium sp. ORS 278]
MAEWLANYWPVILAGIVFGALFSLVKELLRRIAFSVVLFLILYRAVINATAHAGFRWDHLLAGSAVLGILAGCLARPGLAAVRRKLRSDSDAPLR